MWYIDVGAVSPTLDRPIDRADASTDFGSMDLVFIILKFVLLFIFIFFFWKIRTFPRAESHGGHSDTSGVLV